MNFFDDSSDTVSKETMNRRIFGVSVGIVTNNQDPEKLGRVKVKLPLRECENETDWARVASIMTGNNMGAFCLPEVGDEVLLAFNEGNVRDPYVIGMLWNSKEKPPEDNADGNNNIRKFKSRSGHEIIFGDEKGKEKIDIHTAGGHSLMLDDESKKIELKDINSKDTVLIDGSQNQISVESDKKIVLKAKSSIIEIDATGGINIKSNGSIGIESKAAVKIKGQQVKIEAGAMMDIKSSGILNIKGSLVKIN